MRTQNQILYFLTILALSACSTSQRRLSSAVPSSDWYMVSESVDLYTDCKADATECQDDLASAAKKAAMTKAREKCGDGNIREEGAPVHICQSNPKIDADHNGSLRCRGVFNLWCQSAQ